MRAGQTSIGLGGRENFLFPLDEMYITQGSYEYTYSHDGCYAMDFVGYGPNGQIARYPYYAPFTCHLVARWGSTSPMLVWQSDDPVNFVDGTYGYACIGFVHDNDVMSFEIGERRIQGQVIGHTGTYGIGTGDHVHIEAKKGTYDGYHQNSQGVWMLTNSTWLYNLMGINDTVIYKDYYVNSQNVRVNYPWASFPNSHPVTRERSHFPWVLFARKLRERNM